MQEKFRREIKAKIYKNGNDSYFWSSCIKNLGLTVYKTSDNLLCCCFNENENKTYLIAHIEISNS